MMQKKDNALGKNQLKRPKKKEDKKKVTFHQENCLSIGGLVEISSIFQIDHMTKVSTQINSSIPQYDVC
jgi:hypothetical protein